jgi:hypothetical protein
MERRPKPSSTFLYAKCDSESAKETTKHVPPPCLTDNYVNFIRHAYLGALRCLDEEPHELFGLIGNESKFQLNVGNTSHAWGVAQITPGAGNLKVFSEWFDAYRGKPECSGYSDALKFEEKTSSTSCLMTWPPSNPARSFLVAGLVLKQFRGEAAALVPRGASAGDRRKIVNELAMEMYNAGDSAVGACWRNFLVDHPDGASSYARFSSLFPGYLADHYGDGLEYFEKHASARDRARTEVSRYVAGARAIAKHANHVTQKECGR